MPQEFKEFAVRELEHAKHGPRLLSSSGQGSVEKISLIFFNYAAFDFAELDLHPALKIFKTLF